MENYLLLFLICFSSVVHAIELPILGVYDGDTIYTELPLPKPLNKAMVRIYGIDTPEMKSTCRSEKQKGMQAKQYLMNLTKDVKIMRVESPKWDKYGGRVLGTVFIGEKDVAKELIKAGLAREYYGEKKSLWCEEGEY